MFWKRIARNLQSIDSMTTNRKSAISRHKLVNKSDRKLHFGKNLHHNIRWADLEQDYTRNFNHFRTGYLEKNIYFCLESQTTETVEGSFDISSSLIFDISVFFLLWFCSFFWLDVGSYFMFWIPGICIKGFAFMSGCCYCSDIIRWEGTVK